MDGGEYRRATPGRFVTENVTRVRTAVRDAERGLIDETEFTLLWLIALATYGVGDIVTTIALIYFSPTVTEGNALIATVVAAYGPLGLVGLKLLAFAGCLAVALYAARTRERLLYYATPAIVAVAGAFATAWNVRLMMG